MQDVHLGLRFPKETPKPAVKAVLDALSKCVATKIANGRRHMSYVEVWGIPVDRPGVDANLTVARFEGLNLPDNEAEALFRWVAETICEARRHKCPVLVVDASGTLKSFSLNMPQQQAAA